MTSEQPYVGRERESGNTHTHTHRQKPKDSEDKTMSKYLLLGEARAKRKKQFHHKVQAQYGEQGNPAAEGNSSNSALEL